MTDNNLFPFEDWWNESQIAIVEDRTKIWTKKKFNSTAGFWIIQDGHKMLGKISQHEELPPDAILDSTAWDHEHCSLCWNKISENAGDFNEGYTDGKEWICPDCYEKYILPREKNSITK